MIINLIINLIIINLVIIDLIINSLPSSLPVKLTGLTNMPENTLRIKVQVSRKYHSGFWTNLFLREVEPQHGHSELSNNSPSHSTHQFVIN